MDDPVDQLRSQWLTELPDLDFAAMASVARLNRTRTLVMNHVAEALENAGSSVANFDVLSTLRRQGAPYQLKPSSIAKAVMLSPSGMTNRIDHLEDLGLVERIVDPSNRRVAPVALTPAGVAESERLVRILLETEQQLLAGLSAKEQTSLDTLLAKLDASLS